LPAGFGEGHVELCGGVALLTQSDILDLPNVARIEANDDGRTGGKASTVQPDAEWDRLSDAAAAGRIDRDDGDIASRPRRGGGDGENRHAARREITGQAIALRPNLPSIADQNDRLHWARPHALHGGAESGGDVGARTDGREVGLIVPVANASAARGPRHGRDVVVEGKAENRGQDREFA